MVEAPIRGDRLRRSVVTAAGSPAAYAFLLRVASSVDDSMRVDDATSSELASIGFLVKSAAAPRDVRFSAPLAEASPPARLPQALAVNRRIRIDDAPVDPSLAPGRVVFVTDPVRGIELPYWIDDDEERVIARMVTTGEVPRRLAPPTRLGLVSSGILHDPAITRTARRRFGRMLASARARIESPGYVVLGELLPPAFVAAMRRYFRGLVAEGHLPLGDGQVAGRYNMYNERLCVWLHDRVTALIARAVARPIKPSYTYAAAYVGGAVLDKHTDRPQCDYTLSLAIDATPDDSRDGAWPLCLESKSEKAVVKALLAPADALLFRGRRLPHFRDVLAARRTSTSVLFHFVPRGFRGALS